MAVLLGAVVAANLPTWRVDERLVPIRRGGVRLGFSLALIAALARAQRRGRTCRTAGAGRRARGRDDGRRRASCSRWPRPALPRRPRPAAGSSPGTRRARRCTISTRRSTCRSPAAGWRGRSAPWQVQVAPAMERIVKAEAAAMRVTLAALLAEMRRGRRRAGAAAVPARVGKPTAKSPRTRRTRRHGPTISPRTNPWRRSPLVRAAWQSEPNAPRR